MANLKCLKVDYLSKMRMRNVSAASKAGKNSVYMEKEQVNAVILMIFLFIANKTAQINCKNTI